MKQLILTASIALLSAPAWAQTPHGGVDVPEMSVGPAVAAIALLVGAAAIVRERSKRK